MNRFFIPLATTVCALAAASHSDYKTEVREPIHHTFSKAATLDVDNVNGSITVTGDGAGTIRVEGERVTRASDQQEADRAKREVTLDINEKDGIAQLYANGPFRGDNSRHANDNHGFHDHTTEDRGRYEVAFNLIIHVPKATALRLHTVNGTVTATDTAGRYDVKSVNGSITMRDVAGSGTVETLNGATAVTFRENPKTDSLFKSFNGKVEVAFQPNLAADLSVKTFNGQAYTDFEATALASKPETAEKKDGRFVLRSNHFSNLRVGNGGPELKFETFNGNIQIRKVK